MVHRSTAFCPRVDGTTPQQSGIHSDAKRNSNEMESEERSNSGSPFDFRNKQSTDPLPTDSFHQAARPLSFRRPLHRLLLIRLRRKSLIPARQLTNRGEKRQPDCKKRDKILPQFHRCGADLYPITFGAGHFPLFCPEFRKKFRVTPTACYHHAVVA